MQNQVAAKRTGLNIASQWGLNITNIVINFFLIGYVIAKVGTEHYGGWTAIVSIIGYLSVLDAGMSIAIQHYVARFSTSRDKSEKLSSLFSSAYAVYGVSSVVAALLCVGISLVYPSVFPKVPPEASGECVVALRWVSVSILLFMLSMPVRGALLGLQRHYIRNTIEVLSLLVRVGVVVICFNLFGPSLAYLGAAFLGAVLVSFVLSVIALRLIEPDLCFRFSSVTWASIREVFSYGGHSFFWTIATVIVRDSGPILATILINPVAATYLYVGTRLVRSVGIFIMSAGHVFVPVVSSLQASKENSRLQGVLIRGTRLCCLLALSGATVLIMFGRAILCHWVDFEDLSSYLVVVIVTVGRLGIWMFNVPAVVLMGMRVLWPLTIMFVICAGSCFILMPLLAYYCGILGLAVGMLLPLFLAYTSWIPYKSCRLTGTSGGRFLLESLTAPVSVALIVGAAALIIQRIWAPTELWIVVAELGIMLAVFGGLSMWIGLDQMSRSLLLSKMRRAEH